MYSSGQSGLEYMIIVIMAITFITPVLMMGSNQLSDMKRSTDQINANEAVNRIADASESVYAQGAPAKITVSVSLPDNINRTYVGSREIMISLNSYGGPTDIYRRLDFNVTGSIPSDNGRYDVAVQAVKIGGITWVNITGQV